MGSAQASAHIDGVQLLPIVTHADDRGYFRELFKADRLPNVSIAQTSVTETYPGVIKAFHWHERQDDLWYVAAGRAQVVLFDQRAGSATKGRIQVVFCGEEQPQLVLIPRGVVHGYRVLGASPVLLFYHTTAVYDPANPDEQRIPFDDPTIGFDWTTQNR